MYLSYLAAHTSSISLGTAAVVVPFQHPLLMAKRAATIDRLSAGRFLFGVATGDRPEEFPAFGQDKGKRDEEFRERIAAYRRATLTTHTPIRWSGGRMGGADVVPKPQAREVPLLATGSCQQTLEWRAEHAHGWLMYHKGLEVQRQNVRNWNAAVADWAARGIRRPAPLPRCTAAGRSGAAFAFNRPLLLAPSVGSGSGRACICRKSATRQRR